MDAFDVNPQLRRCLERERKRQYKWRHTKQGEFESSMVSIEGVIASGDTDKLRILATGRTLGSVIADPDRKDKVEVRRRKLDHVLQDLRRHGEFTMATVLRLIHKNRENREESICELMKNCTREQRTSTSTIATCSASGTGSGSTRKPKRPCSITQPEKS